MIESDGTEKLMRSIINNVTANLHSMMPCIVREVNNEDATVRCAIEVQRRTSTSEWIDIPDLQEVPVLMPQGGGNSIVFAVRPGDRGILLFADRDISKLIISGQSGPSPSLRRHSLADCLFLPVGLIDGEREELPDEGVEIKEAGGAKIAMADGTIILSGDVVVEGGIIADEDIIAGTISLQGHQHTDSQGGPTTPPLG